MLNPTSHPTTLTRITLVTTCGLKSYDPLVDLTANTRNLVLAAAAWNFKKWLNLAVSFSLISNTTTLTPSRSSGPSPLTPSSAKSLVVKRCWRNYT